VSPARPVFRPPALIKHPTIDRAIPICHDNVMFTDRGVTPSTTELIVPPLGNYRFRRFSALRIQPFRGDSLLVFDWMKQVVVRAESTVLNSFVRLDASKPDEIFQFAKRYGALGLCAFHNLPFCHPFLVALGERGRNPLSARQPDLCNAWNDKTACAESLEGWRAWIDNAWLLVSVAGELKKSRLGRENRKRLSSPGYPFKAFFDSYPPPESFESLRPQRCLDLWINSWLTLANVWVRLEVVRGRFQLALGAQAPLVGRLALELALVASEASALAVCSNPKCGRPYLATRLQAGRDNYCAECRTVRVTAAMQRYRDAKTEALRLNAVGEPVERIAEQLGRRIKTVRKWLSER